MCELQRGAKLLKEIKMGKGKKKVFCASDEEPSFLSNVSCGARRKNVAPLSVWMTSPRVMAKKGGNAIRKPAFGDLYVSFDQVLSDGKFTPLKEESSRKEITFWTSCRFQ